VTNLEKRREYNALLDAMNEKQRAGGGVISLTEVLGRPGPVELPAGAIFNGSAYPDVRIGP
jgi:hypothetical protein